ncbi:hypothetical protein ACVSYG_23205, partial [Salmonella enterica]
AGTVIGGPGGDKIGRKYVILGSIFGVAPVTLVLPYATLYWTGVLTGVIGFFLAAAVSAILVYAQEVLPGGRERGVEGKRGECGGGFRGGGVSLKKKKKKRDNKTEKQIYLIILPLIQRR